MDDAPNVLSPAEGTPRGTVPERTARLLTMSCFRPTKDCSTELAVRTCLCAAAFSPRKRSIRSLTASPWQGRRKNTSGQMLMRPSSPEPRLSGTTSPSAGAEVGGGRGGRRRAQRGGPRPEADAGWSIRGLQRSERLASALPLEGERTPARLTKSHTKRGGCGRPRGCGDSGRSPGGVRRVAWAWALLGSSPSILTVCASSVLHVIQCFPQDFKKEMGGLSLTEAQMSHVN